MTKPEWLQTLSVSCNQCNQKSIHIAFIEVTKDNKTLIYDNHFCPNCKIYAKTPVTDQNYEIFYKNNLSLRKVPIPYDQNKGK